VDLVPTILESAGIPIPYHLQGRSIVPVFNNKSYKWRESALLEGTSVKAIRTENYRYVSWANGKESLYDIEKDRYEYNDVVDEPDYADVLSEMRHLMLRHIISIERPAKRVWAY